MILLREKSHSRRIEMKDEEIKAVDMVRRIRDQHAEELKALSAEERLVHYKERGRKAHEELRRLAAKRHKGEERAI
ncbi:hypothetical protein BH23BAC4_BH23BAC4_03450 [soil metagenome]